MRRGWTDVRPASCCNSIAQIAVVVNPAPPKGRNACSCRRTLHEVVADKTSVRHREPSRSSKLSVPRTCVAQLPLPFSNLATTWKHLAWLHVPCDPRPRKDSRTSSAQSEKSRVSDLGPLPESKQILMLRASVVTVTLEHDSESQGWCSCQHSRVPWRLRPCQAQARKLRSNLAGVPCYRNSLRSALTGARLDYHRRRG